MSKYLDFTIENYEKIIRNLERVERQVEYMSKVEQYVNRNLHGGAKAVINTFIRRVKGSTGEIWQIVSLYTSTQQVVIKKVLGGTFELPILKQTLDNEIVLEEELNKNWQTVGKKDVEKELQKMDTSKLTKSSTRSDSPTKTTTSPKASSSPKSSQASPPVSPKSSPKIIAAKKVGTSIVANKTVYKFGQKIFLVKASVKSHDLTKKPKDNELQWVIYDLSGSNPKREGFLVSTNNLKAKDVPSESEINSVAKVLKIAQGMEIDDWVPHKDLEIKTGIETERIESELLLDVRKKIEQLTNDAKMGRQEVEEQKKSARKLGEELEKSQTDLAALKASSGQNTDKVSLLERNIESLERLIKEMNKHNEEIEARLSNIKRI